MKKASETIPAPITADCTARLRKPVIRESRVKPPTERRFRIIGTLLAISR